MTKLFAIAAFAAMAAGTFSIADGGVSPAEAGVYTKTTICTTNPTTGTKYCRVYTSPVRN